MNEGMFRLIIKDIERDMNGEGYWIRVRTMSGQEIEGAHQLDALSFSAVFILERPAGETLPKTRIYVNLGAIESIQLAE